MSTVVAQQGGRTMHLRIVGRGARRSSDPFTEPVNRRAITAYLERGAIRK